MSYPRISASRATSAMSRTLIDGSYPVAKPVFSNEPSSLGTLAVESPADAFRLDPLSLRQTTL